MAFAGWCSVPIDQSGGPTRQHRCQLGRIGNRRRAADDDRRAAVVGTQTKQAPDHVGDVAPEDAAVCVELVDDDDPELLEQLEPLGVVRQDRRIQHVRVADDDLPGLAHRRPNGGGRVAVVRGRGDRHVRRAGQPREFRDLVLPECLRREQEERPRGRIVGDRLQHRDGVAERLPGRGRRDDDDVVSGVDGLDGVGLVGVEPVDPARCEPVPDAWVQPRWVGAIDRIPGRDVAMVDDATGERRLLEQVGQDGLGGGRSVGAHSTPLKQNK